MMIIILVVAGLLLSVAVFTNLYATIKGPGQKRKLIQDQHSVGRGSFDDERLRIDRKLIVVDNPNGFKYSKGLFI